LPCPVIHALPPSPAQDAAQKRPKQGKWATGWWRQFASCYGRELLSITRNPADVAGRTMTFAWVAILMGLLYYGMAADATSIRGRLNMTFNILSFFCLMPYVSMSLYSADKKFYIAGERQAGTQQAGAVSGHASCRRFLVLLVQQWC
jgi:hypothetical protein